MANSANGVAGGKHVVTLIPGDGIGPEVTEAAVRVLAAAGAPIEWEPCDAGASVFKKGLASGVPRETIDSIAKRKVALKGPLETPVGYGEKSANVTLRKLFETYGNIRPVREMPGVRTPFAGRGIDLVVVRENVEDLYAGIEHQQTPTVAQCLKLISRKGCEKIVRLGFAVARAEGRRTVHCATKANIMKLTEGLLKRTFEELAKAEPDLRAEHIIIDNCAHQLVRSPEKFEVIVTTNMNGDILSDLTSGLVGGLGFAPSANVGDEVAIFEAVHGSAPKYAGKDVANPTALLQSAVMMLRYLGEGETADRIDNALLVTYEEGRALTKDVVGEVHAAGTRAFTNAVIGNLGRKPVSTELRVKQRWSVPRTSAAATKPPASRAVVGFDLFVEFDGTPDALGESLRAIAQDSPFALKMISNRGTKVFPNTGATPDAVDHWRCRFLWSKAELPFDDGALLSFVGRVARVHPWMHIEKLQRFDGADGFTRAQGED